MEVGVGVVIDARSSIQTMSDASHANFYVVSATVIPVLFLAFALQSSFVEWLRKAAEAAHKALDSPDPWRGHLFGRAMLVISLALIGRLTLLFGILGEVLALWALMDDQDAAYFRHVIFWIIIVLLVEVAAGLAFVAVSSPEILLYHMTARMIFGEQPTETSQDSRDLKAKRKKEPQTTDDQS
jgi:hypothetical protein